MGLVLFGVLFLLLLISIPIAIALGVAVLVAITAGDMDSLYLMVAQRMFTAVDNFPFMAVPFFILAGNIMGKGGISHRLIHFTKLLYHAYLPVLPILLPCPQPFSERYPDRIRLRWHRSEVSWCRRWKKPDTRKKRRQR